MATGSVPGNQRLLDRDVFQVAARWAVAQQHSITIEQCEGRHHEGRQVYQAGMNLLVQAIALASQDAEPVLEAERRTSQGMVLGNRQIDDFIGLQKRFKYLPAL